MICCEGNAGYYEVGILNVAIEGIAEHYSD